MDHLISLVQRIEDNAHEADVLRDELRELVARLMALEPARSPLHLAGQTTIDNALEAS